MSYSYVPATPETRKRRLQLVLAAVLIEAPVLAAGVFGYLATNSILCIIAAVAVSLVVMGFVVVRYVSAVVREDKASRGASPAPSSGPDIVQ